MNKSWTDSLYFLLNVLSVHSFLKTMFRGYYQLHAANCTRLELEGHILEPKINANNRLFDRRSQVSNAA